MKPTLEHYKSTPDLEPCILLPATFQLEQIFVRLGSFEIITQWGHSCLIHGIVLMFLYNSQSMWGCKLRLGLASEQSAKSYRMSFNVFL